MHAMESMDLLKKQGSGYCDMEHLIRSVQRADGDPDCFRTGKKECDQAGCRWRYYCLECMKTNAE